MRPFFIALLCLWTALLVAALYLSRQHPHSHWIMAAALPAFLVEAFFYLASIFEETRDLFRRISPARTQAALLWISALLPYLVFSFLAGTFDRSAFYLLALLCGVFAFWHAVLPRRLAYELGFLVIAAAPILLRVFPRIYRSPDSHLRVDILGHLMWIRVGILALLVLREWDPGPLSFWPRKNEWAVGLVCYVAVLVPIVGVALLLHDVTFTLPVAPWWRTLGYAVGTFLGMLWVVALGEELFFRGVIERALYDWRPSPVFAVSVSAVLFGAAHLWFHAFPNWQRAVVATVLGVACGIAYLQTGSVRAPMVTHACVVATWRVFFV